MSTGPQRSASSTRPFGRQRGRLGSKPGLRTYLALMFKVAPNRTGIIATKDSGTCQQRARAIATRCVMQKALLDQFVGAREKRRRNAHAQGFGSLKIDNQLELGRLLYW